MDLAPPRQTELDELDLQPVPVLSIDQIRAIRASNDYVERPLALEPGAPSGLFLAQDERHGERHSERQGGHIPRSQSLHYHAHLAQVSHSSTVSSLSRSSTTSDQRLLGRSRSSLLPVRSQPKAELKPDALGKRLAEAGRPGRRPSRHPSRHLLICERCGRCKCAECGTPRSLPSHWLCQQRCLCSAESALEGASCLCCVKGLFYHCSADDEDDCADRPCSCGPAHRCSRWAAMGALSLCLPCLCCYPPAKLCLSACQRGYDRATRPGCRCSNTNTVCRKISASNPAPFPKSLEKPV
ncbi:protein sprouty homolog 3 [Anguilla anguilla]|uniref:protein sprouty homolog 3 n=1 Tax=Anguilla anguilla TaxID=7936 RepID=UPI0015AE0540|nr:protein sprouty homolog 3 [Anguilla anguilla]